MKVQWLGHACFLITSEAGLRIITDPYMVGGGIRYSPIQETADIVTVSHDHADHNNAAAVGGKPALVKGAGRHQVKGIKFQGHAAYHDGSQGRERGTNTIYCLTVDGIRLCHLGDLGHPLSEEQARDIGPVDVLLIPVGGFFTIDAATASQICQQLRPRLAIPMHYKTSKLDYPLAGVEDFLRGKSAVKRLESSEIDIKADHLPATTEIVALQSAL